MRTNKIEGTSHVVEYEIVYADKSLPEDRKAYLDGLCIRALRSGDRMPDGVESVREIKRR